MSATAKHCDIVECQTTADCCGDLPMEPPPECANRDTICQSTIPGCTYASCTTDAQCNGGTCGIGYCSNDTLTSCSADTDCSDTCVANVCTISFTSCALNSDCLGGVGTCFNRTCSCTNPQYDPSDPICSSTYCTNVCVRTCQEERCVVDTSCESDLDCYYPTPLCNAGKCVECVDDTTCDTEYGQHCVNNVCKAPCTQNEECPLFNQCRNGECVETGCTSDRECVLAADNVSQSFEDPRLFKCLPSDEDPDIKQCKIPCENDGACGPFEVCDNGFCKFIGCNTDEECRAYLGLENEVSSSQPFIPKAVCRQ